MNNTYHGKTAWLLKNTDVKYFVWAPGFSEFPLTTQWLSENFTQGQALKCLTGSKKMLRIIYSLDITPDRCNQFASQTVNVFKEHRVEPN